MPADLPIAQTRTRYGTANPERVENDLWSLVIRENWQGYQLRRHLGADTIGEWREFWVSSYRDDTPGPYFSWERFGRTSTPLPDGRIIHIAGEHEDSTDPDFCIYNDVVVEHPDGRHEIFLYPADVFPPTDFHTATLIGDDILLVGSLSYDDLRRPGETQVLRLDTRTMRIEPVATIGEGPGWVSRHLAERIGDSTILVVGGKVDTGNDYEPNTGIHELDFATQTWRARAFGDDSVFPVSSEGYRRYRNPRFGRTNPERIDNPFWLEMARRQWPSSRARLHYGDFARPRPQPELPSGFDLSQGPPEFGSPEAEEMMARISASIERSKLPITIDDVVWTAVREHSLTKRLPDGRSLLIGGEVLHYSDEYADSWVYRDVIVTGPDGSIDILIYPEEDFPRFHWCEIGAVFGGSAWIFGTIDRQYHPDHRGGPVVLSLNIETFALSAHQVEPPSAALNIFPGASRREGDRVVFSVWRQREADPELDVAFDLNTLAWSGPFPHRSARE